MGDSGDSAGLGRFFMLIYHKAFVRGLDDEIHSIAR